MFEVFSREYAGSDSLEDITNANVGKFEFKQT